MGTLDERFNTLPNDRKILAQKLVSEILFMADTIETLKEKINTEGPILDLINGNGFMTKSEHPAQKSYNTMIKNYLSAMKQLNDLLPDATSDNLNKAGDALKSFIQAGKK